MRSRLRTVDSRCAITIEVRPFISRSIACWISASDSESRLDVASSKISTGASARKARASATQPPSPLGGPREEFVRVPQPRRLLDRLQAGAGPAIGDVLGERAMKQDR